MSFNNSCNAALPFRRSCTAFQLHFRAHLCCRDVLAQQNYRTSSFSVAGNSIWAQGFDTLPKVVTRNGDSKAGRLSRYDEFHSVIANITSTKYSNMYCEQYQLQLSAGIDDSEKLGTLLDKVTLKTQYDAPTRLAMDFKQVARLIATREDRKAERDFFFVSIGAFDTHGDMFENVEKKFQEIDGALAEFVAELEAQAVFNDTAIISSSDFGRTLTSNGQGTDHGWAGNHFIVSGSVNGGRVYNDFPASLLEGNDQDAKRGRLIPKYPWESMMVPVARWLGLDQTKDAAVFPNLANFNSTHIIDNSVLFPSTR